LPRNPNREWRKAMWKAVGKAAGNGKVGIWVGNVHPLWGMRAIRYFERINGVPFDPFNSAHLKSTFNTGRGLFLIRMWEERSQQLGRLVALRERFQTALKPFIDD
jgi:hypothetical protein